MSLSRLVFLRRQLSKTDVIAKRVIAAVLTWSVLTWSALTWFVLTWSVLTSSGAAFAAAGPHASPVLGEPVVRVLQASERSTRLEIFCPVERSPENWDEVLLDAVIWSRPLDFRKDESGVETISAPILNLNLAVPTTAPVNCRILELDWWKQPRQGDQALKTVAFSTPSVFRFVPISGAQVPLGIDEGVLRRLVLEVEHKPAGKPARQLAEASNGLALEKLDGAQPLVPSGLLNPELFISLNKGGRLLGLAQKTETSRGRFNHFDLTENWIKIQVDETGLFRLTGQDLSGMGLPVASVDPEKLRLYRGGTLAIDRNPEIPEADQADRVGLTEVAIQVIDGQDGEWNLDDEIRFYGFTSDFWLDRVDPDAAWLDHYNHPEQNGGLYWLTWENAATPATIPGAPLRVARIPATATGGQDVSTAKLRRHFEEQIFEVSGAVMDNWVLLDNLKASTSRPFALVEPVANAEATFVLDVRGQVEEYGALNYPFMANGWVNGESSAMSSITFNGSGQVDSTRVRVIGETHSLVNGTNSITLQAANPAREYGLMLDCYQLLYWAHLDMTAHSNQLEFVHWRDQVTSANQAVDLKISVPASGSFVIWDVTDPTDCALLQPDVDSGTLTCGVIRQPDQDRHFLVTELGDLHQVSSGERVVVPNLRATPLDVDYITIYPEIFESAAQRLTDYRNTSLPGDDSPVALAYKAADIYANFSGGQKDPYAFRSFLKQIYENGGGNLRFVCLLGNTTLDKRNYMGQDPAVGLVDLLPSVHKTFFPQNPESGYQFNPFGTDDPIVSFESPTNEWDLDLPDVAVGRLPAVDVNEAEALVDRMIAYDSNPENGLWRNRVMFAADDCIKPSSFHYPEPNSGDHAHTLQAEYLADRYLPGSIDLEKIYGVAYEFPPGSSVKPAMRADINAALNDGLSMWYYVGHGAENNLADEQIFQSSDIANLTNGMKRFVFVAFSCDVGVYNSTSRRSMAEFFLTADNGGAIASICASQVSFVSANNDLSDAFFGALYPGQSVLHNVSLSEALLSAKGAMTSLFLRRNSQRFNLLSDPATVLPNAWDDLRFADSSVDTLRSGRRQVAVLDDSRDFLVGFGDVYNLKVEESAFEHGYVYTYVDSLDSENVRHRVPVWDTFFELGSTVFEGSGTVGSSELRVPFVVPSQLRYGDRGRVRMMVETDNVWHAVNARVPAVRESGSNNDDLAGPSIHLAFEDNRYRVQAGTELRASLRDTSSIAILGTTAGNSILLEFDNSGFMTDVTDNFTFESNSYQVGGLSFPLPGDLPLGEHQAALFASDALGNVGNDTISFFIVPESVVGMEDVTVFPNPTPGPCRMVMELSDPMLVKWDIFTTAGRRIKTVEENLHSGPQILRWDGRDDQGDEIAIGTYIYVLRGHVIAGGERDITKTGKLVIMR